MCLAVPGLLERIDPSADPRMGTVNFGGIRKEVCVDWVPEAQAGQYVIVHAGFAISVLDEEEARETLRLLEAMSAASGPPEPPEHHR